MSAMPLLMPAVERDVSRDASLMWILMASAHVRCPTMGEHEALSLLVQLMVGVLSHQAAMCTCLSQMRCANMM